MGMNKRSVVIWQWLVFVALSFLLTSGVGSAQSLAEMAKKEKQRRANTNPEGESRVITERDLQTAYRGLPASTTTPADSAAGEAGSSAGVQADGAEGEEEEAETKTREYWQERVAAAKKKIQDLEQRLQSDEVNWGGGLRTDVNPIGQKNLSQRQEIESQLAQAKAELQAIQVEGRRAGIPPGWVR